eukprot:441296-Amorphochlora_amoeboformis.AAC.1
MYFSIEASPTGLDVLYRFKFGRGSSGLVGHKPSRMHVYVTKSCHAGLYWDKRRTNQHEMFS